MARRKILNNEQPKFYIKIKKSEQVMIIIIIIILIGCIILEGNSLRRILPVRIRRIGSRIGRSLAHLSPSQLVSAASALAIHGYVPTVEGHPGEAVATWDTRR